MDDLNVVRRRPLAFLSVWQCRVGMSKIFCDALILMPLATLVLTCTQLQIAGDDRLLEV